MSDFQWELPCDPSDLVYFRQRIGEQGVSLILAISAQMHGKRAKEATQGEEAGAKGQAK